MRFLFYIVLLLPAFAISQPSWQLVQGMEGGEVNGLARVNTNEIWAGTAAGIFVSNDEGQSWTRHPSLSFYQVLDIDVFNDTIYVILRENGYLKLYTSYDAGQNWLQPSSIDRMPYYYTLGGLNKTGDRLIFNNSYISDDEGATWTLDTLTYFRYGRQTCLANLYRNGYLINYFYDGVTNQFTFIDSTFFVSGPWHYVFDSILYRVNVAQNVATLVRSADLGISWIPVYTFNTLGTSYYMGRSGNDIYAGNNAQPFDAVVSSDGGITWGNLAVYPFFQLTYPNNIPTNNGDYLLYGAGGVVRADLLGNVFWSSSGINSREYINLEEYNGNIYACARNAAYRSSDQGISWQFFTGNNVYDIHGEGDTVLAYTVNATDVFDLYIFNSTNNGATWNPAAYQGQTYPYPSSVGIRKLPGGEHVYVKQFWLKTTTDLGYTTQDFQPTISPNLFIPQIEVMNNELFVLANSESLYKFNNGSWTNVYNGQGLFLTGSNNNYLILTSSDSLCYSNNGGLNWQYSAGIGLPVDTNGSHIFPGLIYDYSGIWIGVINGTGIYYSADQGQNWTNIPCPFPPAGPVCMSSGNTFYCSSEGGGLWKTTLQLSIADQVKDNVLIVFPNPAKDVVYISGPENGAIVFYNAYGQIVYRGNKNNKTISVNVSGLAEGIYYGSVNGKKLKFVK